MKCRLLLTYALALLAALPCASASAQQKPKAEPALVVNGTPLEASVKTVAGKVYVELDQIAKPLNLTISRSTGVIVVESAAKPQQISLPLSPASISGTLTYYFNSNYGNRPDTGSNVYLLSAEKEFELKDGDLFVASDEKVLIMRNDAVRNRHVIVFQTVADGNGRFEFKAVPPGKYTFVAISSHARGKSAPEILGKIRTRSLEIKPGASLDASYDFGVNYF